MGGNGREWEVRGGNGREEQETYSKPEVCFPG